MDDGHVAMASEKTTRIITSSGFPQYTTDFEWKFYKSLVENYFAVNGVADIDQQKELFVSYLPVELLDLVIALIGLENLPQATMTGIFDQLTSYFNTEVNVLFHRRKFYRRDQGEQESISDYGKALKVLADSCSFGYETNSNLCHIFVMGLNQERLQKKLIGTKGQMFDALVRRATALECTIVRDVKGGGDGLDDKLSICVFKDMGCDFKGSVEQMMQHLQTCNTKHLLLSNEILQERMKGQDRLIRSQKNQIEFLQQEIVVQKQMFDAQNEEIRGQKERCDLIEEEVSILKRPEFVWIIKGMAEHLLKADAQTGYRIVSKTFYTSLGYRMEAQLQFNDLEQVGITVSLHPGIYDSILKWPFEDEVNFILNDHLIGVDDSLYAESFVADPVNWPGCKDMPTEVTAPYGIPNFVSVGELKADFIRDDKLMITIDVGTNE